MGKEEKEMSTTHAVIGERDVVALRRPVGGWPAGTEGAAVSVFPLHRWVEVVDEAGVEFDVLFVPAEQLDLVSKGPGD
jgi:hypothetical protein